MRVEKIRHHLGESFWIVVVDHVAGFFDLHQGSIPYGLQPLPQVSSRGLLALLSRDQEHRTLNATEELHGLP